MVTIKKKGRGLKIMKTRQCESRKEDLAVMEPCHATSRGGSNSEINSEIVENVTQKETAHVEKILEALNARSGLLMRQGTVVAAWREYKGKRLGPYYRLVYRQGGRQKSIYLGPSAWVAKQVRAALAKLQTPLRETRRLQLVREMIRSSLRAHQSRAKSLFAYYGIHLKGFEYRGLIRHLKRMQAEHHSNSLPPTVRIKARANEIVSRASALASKAQVIGSGLKKSSLTGKLRREDHNCFVRQTW